MWLYKKVNKVTNELGETISVIFVDTEGLLEEAEDHDLKIFMMTLLFSSHTVLNCKGNFNQSMKSFLGWTTTVALRFAVEKREEESKVQLQHKSDWQQKAEFFPEMTFVIRDSTLKAEING